MNEFFQKLLHEFQLPLQNPVLIFSLILFIILLSPVLLRRLNIPGIIGLIISGVIIGPHGLNILEKNSAVELFSTIGLLYIMFIAGLELDMQDFRSNKHKSLVFGFFTFTIPLSIGFPVCYYFLNYDFNASLLTASMFATHTLVAYPIVSKFGIFKNQAVAITVGGTILTDTAVLILLAIIIGNNTGSLNQEFWFRLIVSLTIFSAIIFILIPVIAKWFFQKLESEKHAHYIFVLSVVFFAAFLAEVAGVESIIGAFMAGLALNKLIPHSSPLMNRIDFIGNALFIPFFLISVGMVVDIKVIFSGPIALIVAGTLTLVALFGKWLAALVTQIIFRFTGVQRQLIFGLSSAHAAATLAIILVGFNAGILDENILNGTIILILITCIVASFATEKAAKKIVLAGGNDTIHQAALENYQKEHILLPVDEISDMLKKLEFALLIKDKKSPNPITILSVVPNNKDAELNIIRTKNKLDEFVKYAAASEVKVNGITTIDYNVAGGIARTSRELMIDMIIIGWPQQSGFLDKILGEKVDNLVNATDKTLFVADIEKPLVVQKRIVIVTSGFAEREYGFRLWLMKLLKLSQELSIPIVLFGTEQTKVAINNLIKELQMPLLKEAHKFDNWDDFLALSRTIQPDDLLVVVSARRGSVSYDHAMDNIPSKLQKYCAENNKLIIYPQEFDIYEKMEGYEDITSEPLVKSIETIEKISKGIGNILRKDKLD